MNRSYSKLLLVVIIQLLLSSCSTLGMKLGQQTTNSTVLQEDHNKYKMKIWIAPEYRSTENFSTEYIFIK